MDYPNMDDYGFALVESGRIETFGHREHLRLAFLAARASETVDEVAARCRAGIQAVAAAKGVPGVYHETITAAWAAVLLDAASSLPDGGFEALLERHPELMQRGYLERFYSPELLGCEAARSERLPPDRAPLPAQAASRCVERPSSQAPNASGASGQLSR
jgi:hypothetical protein